MWFAQATWYPTECSIQIILGFNNIGTSDPIGGLSWPLFPSSPGKCMLQLHDKHVWSTRILGSNNLTVFRKDVLKKEEVGMDKNNQNPSEAAPCHLRCFNPFHSIQAISLDPTALYSKQQRLSKWKIRIYQDESGCRCCPVSNKLGVWPWLDGGFEPSE